MHPTSGILVLRKQKLTFFLSANTDHIFKSPMRGQFASRVVWVDVGSDKVLQQIGDEGRGDNKGGS